MNILVLNCGSSSIKYKHFIMPERKMMAKGLVEKIELPGSSITHQKEGKDKLIRAMTLHSYQEGIRHILDLLTDSEQGTISSLDLLDAAGHRVVHGGEDFSGSVRIEDDVIQVLKKCTDLAPLHNPSNIEGISAIRTLLPHVPQVGVFDTAFHQNIPSYAYLYGIPFSYYEEYKIRRYGFHGTSHRYVSRRACEILGEDYSRMKMITCHLGNGSSVAAIKYGKSIDTSMGMTPTEGVIMGTRCGDIDAGALLKIMDMEGMDYAAASTLVNKHFDPDIN